MTYSPPKRGFPRSRNAMIKELQAACERWARQVDDLEITRDELAAKNRLQAQALDRVTAERDRLREGLDEAVEIFGKLDVPYPDEELINEFLSRLNRADKG